MNPKIKFGFSKITSNSVSGFLGLFTVALASFFITGYIFDRPNFYTLPRGATPVALPTALIFIALGVATFSLSHRHIHEVDHKLETDEARLERIEQSINNLPCKLKPSVCDQSTAGQKVF